MLPIRNAQTGRSLDKPTVIDELRREERVQPDEPFPDILDRAPGRQRAQIELGTNPNFNPDVTYLQRCAEQDPDTGIISINLPPNFWGWIQTINPNVIKQAYIDGTFLSGEHWSAAADLTGLSVQAKRPSPIPAEKILYAKAKLKAYAERHFLKKLLRPSAELKENYQNNTNVLTPDDTIKSFDFVQDFEVQKRAEAFAAKVMTIAFGRGDAQHKNSAIQKHLAHDKHLHSMGVALKRLEMANGGR